MEFLVQEILKAIPNRENYSKVSLAELMTDAGIDFLLDDYLLRYDIRDLVVKEAKKAGYILDYSEFDGYVGGAPFNEPAVIIKPDAVTGADFFWNSGGMRLVEDLAFVTTKFMQKEVQVRRYNGYSHLMDGCIFPVDLEQRVELFSLLDKCASVWENDYSVQVCDGGSWEVRLFSGRKVIRKVYGTDVKPPEGDQLEKTVRNIVGRKNLYLF